MAQTVKVSGANTFELGNQVELSAEPHPSAAATGWKWEFSEHGKDSWQAADGDRHVSALSFTMTKTTAGDYRATATIAGSPVPSSAVHVQLKGSGGGANENPSPNEEPAIWQRNFAIGAALVFFGLGVVFVVFSGVLEADLGLSDELYKRMTTRESLATRMFGMLLLLGVVVMVIGVWMVAVEWRGRFKPSDTPKGVPFPAKEVLETLSKLKGAGLVLLVALAVVLAAAWIGSSAVADPNPSPTPSATPG